MSVFIVIIILVLFNVASPVIADEGEWTLTLTISTPYSTLPSGEASNRLVAGVRNGATDGFDNFTETVSLHESDDPIQAHFPHGATVKDVNADGIMEGWSCPEPETGYSIYQCSLWRDFKPLSDSETWAFNVLSLQNGATVTLRWSFDNKSEDMEILLVDLSNPSNSIDMMNGSFYSYTTNFESGKKYGIRYFEIRTKMKGLFITPTTLPDATVGTLYNKRLLAIGGTPVWSIEDEGPIPAMRIDPYTGEITGTLIETGPYRFTVRAVDPIRGYSSSRDYTININPMPKIDTPILPDGVVGSEYAGQIAATGGSAPIIWGIKGNLPEGVTLDSRMGIISGRLVVPGIYNLTATIKDANGATDSKEYRITVIEPEDKNPPAKISDLREIYITDTSVLLMWSAPVDDSIIGTAVLYDLRYMKDCSTSGELDWGMAIEVSGEPRPQTGALQTYTLTGLESDKSYCVGIKSIDSSGHVSSISNIVRIPLPWETGGSGLSEMTGSIVLRKGYNLISFPVIPVPNGRDSLLGPVVGEPVSLYRWYSAYPGITPAQYYVEDIVMPGLGYLLYSPADDMTLIIQGLETEDTEYSVTLQSGWNMIGTPFNATMLLREVQVKNRATGEVWAFIDAVKAGWIGNTIYQLKSGNYDFASFNDDPPASFEPWVGYWIYAGEDNGLEIIFRKP